MKQISKARRKRQISIAGGTVVWRSTKTQTTHKSKRWNTQRGWRGRMSFTFRSYNSLLIRSRSSWSSFLLLLLLLLLGDFLLGLFFCSLLCFDLLHLLCHFFLQPPFPCSLLLSSYLSTVRSINLPSDSFSLMDAVVFCRVGLINSNNN